MWCNFAYYDISSFEFFFSLATWLLIKNDKNQKICKILPSDYFF